MDTTIISDDGGTSDQSVAEVAAAANAAGMATANAEDAQESAMVAETSASIATSAAETASSSVERTEAAASQATGAAVVAESTLTEAQQIRNDVHESLTYFAEEVRNALRPPESAGVPASPSPRVPVSGPESDTAPGKTHWLYRKWGSGK